MRFSHAFKKKIRKIVRKNKGWTMHKPTKAQMREIDRKAKPIEAGKVKPTVSKTFPLREAVVALQLVEQGHTQGKVVLTVD